MTFLEKLRLRWQTSQSLLCVGLDPDPARMPASLRGNPRAIATFCCDIVDATAAHACAFKPQIAYFAACGAEDQLQIVLDHIRDHHGDIPIVLDAKRGDIGPTATQYAREAFDRYGADAVTINPYMGTDSVSPYLAWADRGVFVLCRTSNAGGDDLQSLAIAGTHPAQAVYERVAELCAGPWNTGSQVGLVVGATYPAELARVRALAPLLPLLVPGIGAQGGDIESTVAAGLDAQGAGLLINSSRAILYAGGAADYARAAGNAAHETAQAIEAARRRVLQLRR